MYYEPLNPPSRKRKQHGKILPNLGRGYGRFPNYENDSDEKYSEFKTRMLGTIREKMKQPPFYGLPVNNDGQWKTNTTEYSERWLRRMIKEGLLKQKRYLASGKWTRIHNFSVLVIK